MGATFSRLKNWTTEVLSDSDLNAEIDNILNNLGPAGVDDYSTNAAQMRLQTDPGSVGSESLPTSLAGEVERLRFVIKRIIGTAATYWYSSPTTSLTDLVSVLGSGLPQNRISSGKTTGNSSQLNCLIPSGTTASLTLTASTTNPFSYYVAGTLYTLTASTTLTGLALSSASNTTLAVNKLDATANQQWAKSLGQYGTSIYCDGMNSGPTALVGQIAGFSATAAGTTEYFIAYVDSTTALTNAWRGCFFNQTPAAVTAVAFNDNDIIKLNKLTWIFANTNTSLAVTYNNPAVSGVQPASPAVNDYWFDIATTVWKTYNGTSWNAANATLIGMSLQNTAACVAARTFDAYRATSDIQSLKLERISNTQVQAQNMFGKVSVFGNLLEYGTTRPIWDITTMLEAGVTETVDTIYYLYLSENGSPMMTDKAPMVRLDLQGLYYPTETWRCVGSVDNDSSTNMLVPARTFRNTLFTKEFLTNPSAYRTAEQFGTAGSVAGLTLNNWFNSNIQVKDSTGSVTTTSNVTVNTMALQRGLWNVWAAANVASTLAATNVMSLSIGLSDQAAASTGGLFLPTTAAQLIGKTVGPFPIVVTAASTQCELRASLAIGVAPNTVVISTLYAVRMDKVGGTD